jgi:hypothetical protein
LDGCVDAAIAIATGVSSRSVVALRLGLPSSSSSLPIDWMGCGVCVVVERIVLNTFLICLFLIAAVVLAVESIELVVSVRFALFVVVLSQGITERGVYKYCIIGFGNSEKVE